MYSITNNMAHASDLSDFLSNHKVFKGDDFSHTSLSFPSGSFWIPYDKTAEFHDIYYNHIRKGGKAYLTEKHKSLAPILIDLDFRYVKDAADVKRVYTQEQLKEFTISYVKVLSEYVDLSNEPTIFILEKPSPKIDDKNINDDPRHRNKSYCSVPSPQQGSRIGSYRSCVQRLPLHQHSRRHF